MSERRRKKLAMGILMVVLSFAMISAAGCAGGTATGRPNSAAASAARSDAEAGTVAPEAQAGDDAPLGWLSLPWVWWLKWPVAVVVIGVVMAYLLILAANLLVFAIRQALPVTRYSTTPTNPSGRRWGIPVMRKERDQQVVGSVPMTREIVPSDRGMHEDAKWLPTTWRESIGEFQDAWLQGDFGLSVFLRPWGNPFARRNMGHLSPLSDSAAEAVDALAQDDRDSFWERYSDEMRSITVMTALSVLCPIHFFYLGRRRLGIAYLLTGGFFLAGWLVVPFLTPKWVREHNETLALAILAKLEAEKAEGTDGHIDI